MEPSSIFTQERVRIDGSVKNETRHKSLNGMVHKVTHISEKVMAILLDIAIFITNKNLDKKYGRADQHSFGLFLGCSDNDLNAWAADFLDGPVFFPLAHAEVNDTNGFRPPVGSQGSAQLPKLGALKIYNEDAPEYEPMWALITSMRAPNRRAACSARLRVSRALPTPTRRVPS